MDKPLPTAPKASSAWIAPNGDFYEVAYEAHWTAACRILGVPLHPVTPADDELEQRGWVHLSSQDVWSMDGAVTQAQLNTLWDVVAQYPDSFWGSTAKAELMQQLNELDVI